MKIAAIAKVIKDRGSCHIVRIHGAEDTETSMFIGTGSELYSLEGFPKPWTEAEIMTMLGMQKKQWEDVIYKESLCDTAEYVCGMNLEDALQNEIECRKSSINLCIGGALLMGLMTPDEKTIDFIPVSKLAPVMDEIKKSDYINYCLRRAKNGSRYYVVRDGMMVRAAILPITLSEGLVKGMQNIVNMTQNTVQSCKTEDKEAE